MGNQQSCTELEGEQADRMIQACEVAYMMDEEFDRRVGSNKNEADFIVPPSVIRQKDSVHVELLRTLSGRKSRYECEQERMSRMLLQPQLSSKEKERQLLLLSDISRQYRVKKSKGLWNLEHAQAVSDKLVGDVWQTVLIEVARIEKIRQVDKASEYERVRRIGLWGTAIPPLTSSKIMLHEDIIHETQGRIVSRLADAERTRRLTARAPHSHKTEVIYSVVLSQMCREYNQQHALREIAHAERLQRDLSVLQLHIHEMHSELARKHAKKIVDDLIRSEAAQPRNNLVSPDRMMRVRLVQQELLRRVNEARSKTGRVAAKTVRIRVQAPPAPIGDIPKVIVTAPDATPKTASVTTEALKLRRRRSGGPRPSWRTLPKAAASSGKMDRAITVCHCEPRPRYITNTSSFSSQLLNHIVSKNVFPYASVSIRN